MFLERFFVEGLAQASYLFGANGEAAVVDPKRDVDEYLAAAQRHGARIVAVLETHPHADFVSGHLELSQRVRAPIYVAANAPARYPHVDLRHGEQIGIGSLAVNALETPGHSPDSLSFALEDVEGDGRRILFTGDALFVGDVGRPDLRDADADPRALADALYATLHDVLFPLPDDTLVYPAHGAGSLCGRQIGGADHTTIGAEKRANWANRFATREEFVQAMLSNLPARPRYFSHDVAMNLAGARPLAAVPRPRRLEPAAPRGSAAVVIDTRTPEAFGAGHLSGSLAAYGEMTTFSTWVGFFVDPGAPVVLVVSQPEAAEKAWLDLARIGYESIAGYLLPDAADWRAAGLDVREIAQMDAAALEQWLSEGKPLLDVRTAAEHEAGHVAGALWIPLPDLPARLDELPNTPTAVMCDGGFRSSIATSLMERAGRQGTVNVAGGWSGWAERFRR